MHEANSALSATVSDQEEDILNLTYQLEQMHDSLDHINQIIETAGLSN